MNFIMTSNELPFSHFFCFLSSPLLRFFATCYQCHLDVHFKWMSTTLILSTGKTDGATIKSISENVVVNPGDEAKLSCVVDGKSM